MIHTHSQTEKKTKTGVSPCAPPPPAPETCCELVCFERPNYFCGHMLTDADLTLEQRYLREKNKLYHRALHGHGIVCGLRLTCHHHCPGSIWIGEGYAIDDCGNDLVVCEPQPFDVIRALREKRYLVDDEPADPCEPPPPPPGCESPKCYYVTICYKEEPSDFTTPFIAGCRPSLSECEPTRVRETVWFDVLEELPDKATWLEDLRSRIESCFSLFSEGSFANELKTNSETLRGIIKGEGNIERHDQYCSLFYDLRRRLLLHLRKYPDNYNCAIYDEISALCCPDRERNRDDYPNKVRDAFCGLLDLAWQNAVSCALGEMIPLCPEPSQGSCIVLGTVEVLDGKVTHVCNCPRDYVWSFAHFFEVLLATLMNKVMCEEEPDDPERKSYNKTGHNEKRVCCREFEFDCDSFFRLLNVNPKAPQFAATAGIDAIRMFQTSLLDAIDFTQPKTFSPKIFQNLREDQARTYAASLGAPIEVSEEPPQPRPPHFFEAIQMTGLSRPEQLVSLLQREGVITAAFADRRQPAVIPDAIKNQIAQAESAATNAETHAHALDVRQAENMRTLEARLAEKQAELDRVTQRLATAEKTLVETREALENKLGERENEIKQITIRMSTAESNIQTALNRLPPQDLPRGGAAGPGEGPGEEAPRTKRTGPTSKKEKRDE